MKIQYQSFVANLHEDKKEEIMKFYYHLHCSCQFRPYVMLYDDQTPHRVSFAAMHSF